MQVVSAIQKPPQQNLTLLAPWSQNSSLQKSWSIAYSLYIYLWYLVSGSQNCETLNVAFSNSLKNSIWTCHSFYKSASVLSCSDAGKWILPLALEGTWLSSDYLEALLAQVTLRFRKHYEFVFSLDVIFPIGGRFSEGLLFLFRSRISFFVSIQNIENKNRWDLYLFTH